MSTARLHAAARRTVTCLASRVHPRGEATDESKPPPLIRLGTPPACMSALRRWGKRRAHVFQARPGTRPCAARMAVFARKALCLLLYGCTVR